MDTFEVIESRFLWLEEYLGSSEPLTSDQNLPAIRQLIVLLASMTFLSIFLSGLIIIYDKAHFLLDILNDLNFCVCRETVASVIQDLLKVFGDVSTSEMNPLNSMGDGITFIYWHCVRDTITGIEDDTCSSTIRVKSQHCLNTNIEAWYIKYFEHYLSHLLPVFFRIQWRLSHKDWMLLR